jgi:Lipopolysaccharide-assembly
MKNKFFFPKICLLLLSIFLQMGCYSLKGITIDPSVKTFYVNNFTSKAALAPAALPQEFSERLRNRVRDEARLKYNDTSPDIEFSGVISDYRLSVEAPRPGEGSAQNRLTMNISVDYVNHINEKLNYKKDFSQSRIFGSAQNLIDVQESLNRQLMDQILSEIINDTFNNW